MKRIFLPFVLAACIAATACSGQPSKSAYQNSTDGLRSLVSDLIAATKASDQPKVSAITKDLKLPNYDAWFKKTFGSDTGAKLSTEYGGRVGDMESAITAMFKKLVDDGQTEIQVRKFDKTGDREATGLQNDALAAMKEPTTLYSVELVKPGNTDGMHLWSWVYTDGGFHLAGKMQAIK